VQLLETAYKKKKTNKQAVGNSNETSAAGECIMMFLRPLSLLLLWFLERVYFGTRAIRRLNYNSKVSNKI